MWIVELMKMFNEEGIILQPKVDRLLIVVPWVIDFLVVTMLCCPF
jgi:hypothetical protein